MRLNITMFLRLSNFAWGRHLHSSLHGIGNLFGKEQLKMALYDQGVYGAGDPAACDRPTACC